jgi:hypothetical protein
MFENGLTDINEQWNNLYADGRLVNKDYHYNESGDVINKEGHEILGLTNPYRKFLGKWNFDIYLYKAAFINPEKLYLTIGHELIHVALFRLGYTDSDKLNGDRHEATAYEWNRYQAAAWGLYAKAEYYYWTGMRGEGAGFGNCQKPYLYQRPILPNRPVKP